MTHSEFVIFGRRFRSNACMKETIVVTGGKPLRGNAFPIPNKNAIVAALPAAILTDEEVVYRNVPKSTDVEKILEMLKLLGAKIDDSDYSQIKITCKNLKSYKVDQDLGGKIRASILFAGSLLARFGKAEIPVPGGCVLGKRSISAHIDVFQKLGVKVEYFDGYARFTAPKTLKKSYDVWQSEASVTATENFAMYTAGVNSNFSLTDSACEPHVAQVLELLLHMGAKISGIGSNRISISGKSPLKGAEFIPEPDFVDIAGYIVAAAITNGEIIIKGANIPSITGIFENWFPKFGILLKTSGKDLIAKRGKELRIDLVNSGFPLAVKDIPKFVPRPWPGFPVDVLPVIVTLACKLKGSLLVQNWMYETGLDFIRELNSMGADIFMCDPQRIIVKGPVIFNGGDVTPPGVIQACKAIFLASLCDSVATTIHGADILKRRYPDIFEAYKSLGADIKVVSE